MAALPRVYDLAKELGIDTKVALEKLKELGEFVKGGSSTITPPVAKKLRDAFPNAKPKVEEPKAAPKAAKPSPAPEAAPEVATPKAEPEAPKAETPAAPAAPAAPSATPGIPRPGNNPFAGSPG